MNRTKHTLVIIVWLSTSFAYSSIGLKLSTVVVGLAKIAIIVFTISKTFLRWLESFSSFRIALFVSGAIDFC